MDRSGSSSSSSSSSDGGGGGGEGRCLWKIIKIENSMISTLPDDLLKEILIRLPDLKSSIRCGLVCKRWWSSTVSRPDFVAGFMEHHRSKVPPLRLVLRDNFIHGNTIHINLPLRLSLYPPLATVADSFPSLKRFLVPDSSDLIAASRDLLLFSVFSSYYVCNPLTGQRFRLPGPPRMSGHLAYSGLVSEPNNNNNNNRRVGSFSRYRVMLMYYSRNTLTYTTIFCSETGQWIRLGEYDRFVSLGNGDVVAGNDGVLYWIHSGLQRLIALDPFKAVDGARALRFIELPGGFLTGIRGQLRVGLFQGRPRVSQLSRVDSRNLCLEVWDLIYDADGDDGSVIGAKASTSWPLVHKVEFEAADVEWMSVFVLALHPSDSDQIFMLRNRNVYQVNLETKTQVRIAEIHSYYKGKMPDLSIFPYAHPEWPTLI